ncbi:MAG: ACT domain-containing protein [Paracoccaceae bacterium]
MLLKVIEGTFAIARLPAESSIPNWMNGAGFVAMVKADDELTLVCDESRVPQSVTADRGWACFRSIGPFAFDETGIVASLVSPISSDGIGVFVLCTFDGEHILCPFEKLERVKDILISEGHRFVV